MPAPEQVLAPVRLPFSTMLLDGLLAAAIMAIPRVAVRFAARNPITTRRAQHRALIIGAVADLGAAIETWQATEVIIAVPGAKGAFIRKVVEATSPFGITPRIVPGVRDL
ncbi:MAG: hypothetical protein AAB319_09025, partial [Pseudomonadota bacterium]